jgi:hypothetical protein
MKDDHVAVLLEDIQDKLIRLADGQNGLSDKLGRMDTRLHRVEDHTERIPAIEAAITDLSKEARNDEVQLKDHETRITLLEQAA